MLPPNIACTSFPSYIGIVGTTLAKLEQFQRMLQENIIRSKSSNSGGEHNQENSTSLEAAKVTEISSREDELPPTLARVLHKQTGQPVIDCLYRKGT